MVEEKTWQFAAFVYCICAADAYLPIVHNDIMALSSLVLSSLEWYEVRHKSWDHTDVFVIWTAVLQTSS